MISYKIFTFILTILCFGSVKSFNFASLASPIALNDLASQLSQFPVEAAIQPSSDLAFLSLPKPALQAVAISTTYFACIIATDRPGGSIMNNHQNMLIVKGSTVPEAGLGLFAGAYMPEGTVLGHYPGVVRPLLAYSQSKLLNYPYSNTYIWRFTDNAFVVDPTNSFGMLDDVCAGGSDDWIGSYALLNACSGFLGVTTKLARINEPPLGKDCNVRAEENLETREVVFSLSRDVYASEELYLDYGLTYDRSGYQSIDRTL